MKSDKVREKMIREKKDIFAGSPGRGADPEGRGEDWKQMAKCQMGMKGH